MEVLANDRAPTRSGGSLLSRSHLSLRLDLIVPVTAYGKGLDDAALRKGWVAWTDCWWEAVAVVVREKWSNI